MRRIPRVLLPPLVALLALAAPARALPVPAARDAGERVVVGTAAVGAGRALLTPAESVSAVPFDRGTDLSPGDLVETPPGVQAEIAHGASLIRLGEKSAVEVGARRLWLARGSLLASAPAAHELLEVATVFGRVRGGGGRFEVALARGGDGFDVTPLGGEAVVTVPGSGPLYVSEGSRAAFRRRAARRLTTAPADAALAERAWRAAWPAAPFERPLPLFPVLCVEARAALLREARGLDRIYRLDPATKRFHDPENVPAPAPRRERFFRRGAGGEPRPPGLPHGEAPVVGRPRPDDPPARPREGLRIERMRGGAK